MIERKYQMKKLDSGRWLLPGNDGKTFYLIHNYHEDGDSQWQDRKGQWHRITGRFWMAQRYVGRLNRMADTLDPYSDCYGEDWETVVFQCRSRKEAVEDVLSSEARREA